MENIFHKLRRGRGRLHSLLAFLETNLDRWDGVWFAEDDVIGYAKNFKQLKEITENILPDSATPFLRSRRNIPDFDLWKQAEKFFDKPARNYHLLRYLSSKERRGN